MDNPINTPEDWSAPIAPAVTDTVLTASQMQAGPSIAPLTRIFTYNEDEWEAFINEWVTFLPSEFLSVQRFTGAGDKGVDVAAFHDAAQLLGKWDNYQCKHYGKPLGPSDACLEIGKCLWYSFNGYFNAPERYIFVAPKGVSTMLSQLLANATRLKEHVSENWEKSIASKITSTQTVPLVGDFKDFVDGFDFSIFEAASPLQIIEGHRNTPYFVQRFGGGLPPRPKVAALPDLIEPHETTYTMKLFRAYSDHTATEIKGLDDLKRSSKLRGHFYRSREAFYHSESLRVFVRDKTVPGTYESLQDEVCDAVSDTCDAVHKDGLARVQAVTELAQTLKLDAHPLTPSTFPRDLKGICHQLANDNRLDWVNNG